MYGIPPHGGGLATTSGPSVQNLFRSCPVKKFLSFLCLVRQDNLFNLTLRLLLFPTRIGDMSPFSAGIEEFLHLGAGQNEKTLQLVVFLFYPIDVEDCDNRWYKTHEESGSRIVPDIPSNLKHLHVYSLCFMPHLSHFPFLTMPPHLRHFIPSSIPLFYANTLPKEEEFSPLGPLGHPRIWGNPWAKVLVVWGPPHTIPSAYGPFPFREDLKSFRSQRPHAP